MESYVFRISVKCAAEGDYTKDIEAVDQEHAIAQFSADGNPGRIIGVARVFGAKVAAKEEKAAAKKTAAKKE